MEDTNDIDDIGESIVLVGNEVSRSFDLVVFEGGTFCGMSQVVKLHILLERAHSR